jgi:tetratricopeptide (TPR) repeat protein
MKNIVIALLFLCVNVFARSDLIINIDPASENALPAAILKAADEAYQLNLRGLDALERRDLNAAFDLFTQALSVFPQYTCALNNRGVVLYRRGDVAGAQRTWEDVVRRDPQYHVAHYNLGLIHLHSNRPDEAVRRFQEGLRHSPNFTEAMLRIGAIQMRAGRTRQALEQFEKAYRGAPANQDAWNFYSYGLLVSGDTAAAINILKAVGDNAEALAQLGRIEASRRRFSEAVVFLTQAVARGAPATAMVDLASVQIDAGKCGDAMATMNRFLAQETSPGVDAWLVAGFAAKECEGAARALEFYSRGLQRHPRDPLLLHNIGQIHFSQSDFAKAEEAWGALSDAHRDPQLLYKRAVAARHRNDQAAAERHIREAIALDQRADYYDLLGAILLARGDARGAEENFRRALRIDPNNVSAQLNLAMSGKNPADLERAAADAQRRLSSCRGSGCADAALQLSILQYHQKKTAQAASTLEAVREADRDLRIYRHLAVYNRELRRYDRAVATLEAAQRKFSGDKRVRYELAEAHLAAGNPAAAVRIFTELMPGWTENVWRLHYQLGYAYMEMNDLTRARESFERSMAAKRENPAARALLAFVLNRMGQTDQAVRHWEQTAREVGDNATIHINLGLSYKNRGEFDRALESYRRAQQIDQANKAIHINIGSVYQAMGRPAEALRSFTQGLESGKRDLAAYNIYLLSRRTNDAGRAQSMYELLTREFPASVYTSRVSAEMNLMRGDTARALAVFEGIREKDYNDWFEIARIQSQRGQRQSAERALANLPNDGPWGREKRIIQARLAFNAGDFRNAYQMYKSVIGTAGGRDVQGDLGYNIYNMILAAFNGGMHREAIAASRELAQRTQGRTRMEILRVAGNSALTLRDWAEAKNWYGQLVALEPNRAVNHFNLAVSQMNLGEVEEAYSRYRRAQELDRSIRNNDIEQRYEAFKRGGTPAQAAAQRQGRDSLDVWYNRAVDYHNAEKDTLAERLYRRVLGIDSTFSLAWNNLGAIYGARGQLDQAIEAYGRALENQTAPETFANLANIHMALEEFDKAQEVITRGLTSNPGNALLRRMERQVRSRR